jgi:hypothetical protein
MCVPRSWPKALAILALVVGGCASAGPGDPVDPNCAGSKCDEPLGPATPHALAIEDCDSKYEEERGGASASSDELAVLQRYRQCLLTTNNSAIFTIEENLATAGKPARSPEEIVGVFDDFRYASLCGDIESISSLLGDELAIVFEECSARRERSLGHVVSALVDYTGERSTVFLGDQRDTFSACYGSYDEAISQSPDEDYSAREALVACAGSELMGFATVLKDAFCELAGCPDDLLITSFIQAGFESALTTSGDVCELLVEASIYANEGSLPQVLGCELSVYAQLHGVVTDGLGP